MKAWQWSLRTIAIGGCIAALAGCGEEGVLGTTVVLRVGNWGGAGDDNEFDRTLASIYRQFERENPGVKIMIEGVPDSQDYVRKTLLAYVANAEPDVIAIDASSSAIFIDNHIVRDLMPFVEADPDFNLSDYYPNVVDITRRGEAIHAIPMDFTPMVLYYNKAVFDKMQVPYPNWNWTRADFVETAKKLTKGEQFGFQFDSWMPGWIVWLWNGGGDVLSPDGKKAAGFLDSPDNISSVNFLRDLIVEAKVAPNLSQVAASGVNYFENNLTAMQISGHWSMVTLKAAKAIDLSKIDIAPIPNDQGDPKTVMYEMGYGIGKHAQHPDLAWKFIKYMTSYRVQSRYHTTGIAISARRDVSREKATTEIEKKFLKIIPTARGPWGSKVESYDIVEQLGQKMMDGVLKNGEDPASSLKSAAHEIDREFSKL
ncbi:MAG: sugar ABC transporter substrate-binding protein [Armatimonadetes bacterium]|nr:sugar ABC transporter substrate-binding protein [Armatimonadota bacterium]